jgi:hypothetical protein
MYPAVVDLDGRTDELIAEERVSRPRTIVVTSLSPSTFRVVVDEGASKSSHEVTVTAADIERYAPGVSAERLLEASFEFLLAREPKESILSRFELPVIERYFPEYPRTIRARLGA